MPHTHRFLISACAACPVGVIEKRWRPARVLAAQQSYTLPEGPCALRAVGSIPPVSAYLALSSSPTASLRACARVHSCFAA